MTHLRDPDVIDIVAEVTGCSREKVIATVRKFLRWAAEHNTELKELRSKLADRKPGAGE